MSSSIDRTSSTVSPVRRPDSASPAPAGPAMHSTTAGPTDTVNVRTIGPARWAKVAYMTGYDVAPNASNARVATLIVRDRPVDAAGRILGSLILGRSGPGDGPIRDLAKTIGEAKAALAGLKPSRRLGNVFGLLAGLGVGANEYRLPVLVDKNLTQQQLNRILRAGEPLVLKFAPELTTAAAGSQISHSSSGVAVFTGQRDGISNAFVIEPYNIVSSAGLMA